PGELAGIEQLPADVVEPDRLAQRTDGEQRVAHEWLPGRGSLASYPPAQGPSLVRMSDVAGRRSEYESAGLDVADVDADPLRQWQRWYDEAVAAGVTEPNAMALSTLGEDGVPDVRYVLVRGADARGFAFYTNLESVKARQLGARPAAAAVFGWLQLHRQVRV